MMDDHCKAICMKMGKVSRSLNLTKDEINWLEAMAEKFELPDAGKAFRCVCNFASQERRVFPKKIADETAISKIEATKILLAKSQTEWLDAEIKRNGGNADATVHALLSRCMEENEETIFAKIRCKSKTAPRDVSAASKVSDAKGLTAAHPIRILIIQRGFGGGKFGERWIMLETAETDRGEKMFDLRMPDVPEPSEREKGLKILRDAIASFRPHILMAGSRGGKYVASLLQEKSYSGPVFAFSCLSTGAICASKPSVPLFLCHGTRDSTNSIDGVRKDILLSDQAELVEFDDVHHLGKMNSAFVDLVLKFHRRYASDEAKLKWIRTERPEWVRSYLQPKVSADLKAGKEAMEAIRKRRKHRVGLMAALQKKN